MSAETFDSETGEAVRDSLAIRSEDSAMLAPVVSPEEAKAAMQSYVALCEAVLDDADYQEFWQNGVKKRFKKKSAVKKLQTFWGVTVTAPDAVRDDLGEGHFAFRVRAVARKGNREVEAWGACSTQEERFDLVPKDDESEGAYAARQRKALARAYHDVLSTAETRATNRAVMNVIGVGGGEVTADEIHGNRGEPQETLPACPGCGKSEHVRRSQFDDGPPFYCWKKKGGCGKQFSAPTSAQAEPAPSDPPPTAKAQPAAKDAAEQPLFEAPPAVDEKALKRELWAKLKAIDADTRLTANDRMRLYMEAAGVPKSGNVKSIDAAKRVIERYEAFTKELDAANARMDELIENEQAL